MTSITGNARRDAEQRLDSVDHHLRQLRALVASGELDPSPVADYDHERAFASVVTETFGRWVLDLLGLGESDPSDVVRLARMQLVGALSKSVAQTSVEAEQGHDDDLHFVDVFAGDDLVDAPGDELGVKPISYEA